MLGWCRMALRMIAKGLQRRVSKGRVVIGIRLGRSCGIPRPLLEGFQNGIDIQGFLGMMILMIVRGVVVVVSYGQDLHGPSAGGQVELFRPTQAAIHLDAAINQQSDNDVGGRRSTGIERRRCIRTEINSVLE